MVSKSRSEPANPIDALMERASRALVRRRYFECEQTCSEALRAAHATMDYERMARVLLPLEESRRQKRDLAIDAGHVEMLSGTIPEVGSIQPGCYLVAPPRVGADGRSLREAADRAGIPIVVVVREPTTRAGLWPIVALGPVTIRTKVEPPKSRTALKRVSKRSGPTRSARDAGESIVPTRSWFLRANEQLGDAAIAAVDPSLDCFARVEALTKRLEALPDHEKLHQALSAACRDCLHHISAHGRPKRPPHEAGRREKQGDIDPDL